MTKEQAIVGTRVRANVDFSDVRAGTEGIIDNAEGNTVMVAWDLPNRPLPKGYRKWDGRPAFVLGFMRDGFNKESELHYLDVVQQVVETEEAN